MLKLKSFTYISFSILALIALIPLQVFSGELTGLTLSGARFIVEASSTAKPPNPDGSWGSMNLNYRVENNKLQEEYVFPVKAPATLRKSELGLVIISEKIGGMNGTYKATYLYPTDSGLTTIGGVELDMDNGKYIDVNQTFPKWVRRVNMTEKARMLQSIAINRWAFISSEEGQSFDNAMLFFVFPELMDEIRKIDPIFPINYSTTINNEIDSSIANLLRRRFLGDQVSLCNSEYYDVFACKAGEKVISICLVNSDGVDILQYRAGSNNKIELSLNKRAAANIEPNKQLEIFENGKYRYKIDFGNGNDASTAGLIVEKDGVNVFAQKCQQGKFEPYLLPRN